MAQATRHASRGEVWGNDGELMGLGGGEPGEVPGAGSSTWQRLQAG